MHIPLQPSDLAAVKILCRPHPEDPNSLNLLCNVDLFVPGQVMQQLHSIVNQYIQQSGTLHMRKQLEHNIMHCLAANIQHISLSPIAGWNQIVKSNDLKDFNRMWVLANGDVEDVQVK